LPASFLSTGNFLLASEPGQKQNYLLLTVRYARFCVTTLLAHTPRKS